MEIEAGMLFAVETYCPAGDGMSAARIEEEIIVTPSGAKIITLFPAEELPDRQPVLSHAGVSTGTVLMQSASRLPRILPYRRRYGKYRVVSGHST